MPSNLNSSCLSSKLSGVPDLASHLSDLVCRVGSLDILSVVPDLGWTVVSIKYPCCMVCTHMKDRAGTTHHHHHHALVLLLTVDVTYSFILTPCFVGLQVEECLTFYLILRTSPFCQ